MDADLNCVIYCKKNAPSGAGTSGDPEDKEKDGIYDDRLRDAAPAGIGNTGG
jgi:hypothetical protein